MAGHRSEDSSAIHYFERGQPSWAYTIVPAGAPTEIGVEVVTLCVKRRTDSAELVQTYLVLSPGWTSRR